MRFFPQPSTPEERTVIVWLGGTIVVVITVVAFLYAWRADAAGNSETAAALRSLAWWCLGFLALVGGVFWLLMSFFQDD